MSETDDTDVLLLIPPDFFLIHTSGSEDSPLESSRTVVQKPPSCTAQVIGKLVDTVHSLESRLENLELNSTITDSSLNTIPRRKNWDTDSCEGHSFERKSFTLPRRRRRKLTKRENKDFSLTSLDSSSTRKSIPRLPLKYVNQAPDTRSDTVNDSHSMDGDLSSIVSTPSKKNDKLLLHEIDEFLTKVEAYETPDTKFKESDTTLSPENVIKATGDYIAQKLSKSNVDDVKLPSGRTISNAVLDKYIYLVKSNPQSAKDKPEPSTSTSKLQFDDSFQSRPSDTAKESQPKNVETKSPSIRRLNFPEYKDVQPTSTPKKPTTASKSYVDNFRPSSNKIYERATKVLEQHKSQNSSRSQKIDFARDDFKMPEMRPFPHCKEVMKNRFLDTVDTELLSLSDLWGEKEKGDRGDSIKLEEERLKREHCEEMIQQLQKKVLEQQEKLAVAMKVDRAKDAAICKLREAWLRLTGNLDKAEERHRAGLEKMITELENFRTVASEAQKKTDHFEAELYKALDLAHDYQEKYKQQTLDFRQAQDNSAKALQAKDDVIAAKEHEIAALKENYETVMRLNKQSTDCVKSLEDALEKEKSDHGQTRCQVTELNRKLNLLMDETSLSAKEREVLKGKVNEERSRACLLERQLEEMQNQLSEVLNKCDSQDNEIKALHKHLELQKAELKSHYQKQLEDAVLAKLQEFQEQLNQAEREMENNARGKETAMVDNFNKQIARIEEQHKLEISVLEEKQREEIKLCRLQLAQASEKIGLLEVKLESYRRRRTQIASQLHGVMEAQWRQALSILTGNGIGNGNSNGNGQHGSSFDINRPDSTSTPVATDYAPPKVPPSSAPPAHNRNDFQFDGLSDQELHQYVKLLLTKPPNLDGSGDSCPREPDPTEEPTSDRPHQTGKSSRKSLNKPPWKS